jgi:hypothetical protein
MKTGMSNLKMMVITLTAAFSLSFTTASLAINKKVKPNGDELQFIGKKNNHPLFQMLLNNEEATVYLISVKAENGQVIFSEKLKGTVISRVYQLDTDNSELISGTSFEIINKATNITTIYKIHSLHKKVEEIVISKK